MSWIKLVVCLMAVFSFGCAVDNNKTIVVQETVVYVNEFNFLAGTDTPELTVDFAELNPGEAGRFVRGHGEAHITIIINPATWKRLCPSQKRALMFHELGHAVLRRHHATGMTYMLSALQSCEFYNDNMSQLDAELFNQ